MNTIAELSVIYQHHYHAGSQWLQLKQLYAKFIKNREQSILDATASGAVLHSLLTAGQFDPDTLSPQAEEAFHLAYPYLNIEDVTNYSAEQLAGLISGWKGKLFEVEVRDRLNEGEWVGDLHLADGQYAELATSATQPGWDLAINNSDGVAIDQIQLKATESLSYVKSALEKYPDINILTTSEIISPDSMVSVSDISDEYITNAIADPISDSLSDSLLDTLLPGLPLAIIAMTEGYGVLTKKRNSERAVERAVSRAGKGILAGLVGWGLSAMVGDATGLAGAFVVRMALGGESDEPKPVVVIVNYENMQRRLNNAKTVPSMLLSHYP